MNRCLVSMVFLVACGGPALESHELSSRGYMANATCGQDLVRTHFAAKGSKHGESVTVIACSDRAMSGTIEVEADRTDTGTLAWSSPFGDEIDNARCLSSDARAVSAGEIGTTANSGDRGGASSSASKASASKSIAPASMTETLVPHNACPYPIEIEMHLGILHPQSPIRVRIWSRQPVDLHGASIRLVHNELRPNVSDEEWAKHVAKREREGHAHSEELIETPGGPSGPPPDARAETKPPRPSRNAEWIPGYYHWASSWHWIGGHWRTPDRDIEMGWTVSAPSAPPRDRDEAAIQIDGMVWIPGYWAWDGASYRWVAGRHDRARDGVRWRRPRWEARGAVVVFVPGGWFSL